VNVIVARYRCSLIDKFEIIVGRVSPRGGVRGESRQECSTVGVNDRSIEASENRDVKIGESMLDRGFLREESLEDSSIQGSRGLSCSFLAGQTIRESPQSWAQR